MKKKIKNSNIICPIINVPAFTYCLMTNMSKSSFEKTHAYTHRYDNIPTTTIWLRGPWCLKLKWTNHRSSCQGDIKTDAMKETE